MSSVAFTITITRIVFSPGSRRHVGRASERRTAPAEIDTLPQIFSRAPPSPRRARPPVSRGTRKSFLVLFFKKEQKQKHFFLKKEAKTFVRWARYASSSPRISSTAAANTSAPLPGCPAPHSARHPRLPPALIAIINTPGQPGPARRLKNRRGGGSTTARAPAEVT
jgi:hypothetical protein